MKNIFIAVSWPYANGEKHIGQIAGTYLPADIFARFNRLSGNNVLMLSGSDMHGTPIMLMAEKVGMSPLEFSSQNHDKFVSGCKKLGISFDIFTNTKTTYHRDVVQSIFKSNIDAGIISKGSSLQPFDEVEKKYLPDRYVEGQCPHCGYQDARGDQCDECGKIIDPIELISPRSKLGIKNPVSFKETEHYYIDLNLHKAFLIDWLESKKGVWSASTLNQSLSMVKQDELPKRSITRDLNWGVEVPDGEFEDKRFYVWYEAVIGYLSATIEATQYSPSVYGNWEQWISEKSDVSSWYFIGKDNIPFHAIIWPAIIKSSKYNDQDLRLPDHIVSSHYLTLGGTQFSTSRGNVIGFNSVTDRFESDVVRYSLAALYPKNGDVEFTWALFRDLANNELIANWGNLVSRTVNFIVRKCNGVLEFDGHYSERSVVMFNELELIIADISHAYQICDIKLVTQTLCKASSLVNKFYNDCEPWKIFKTDLHEFCEVMHATMVAILKLNLLWAPVTPNASEKLHKIIFGEKEFLFDAINTAERTDENLFSYHVGCLKKDKEAISNFFEKYTSLPDKLVLSKEANLFTPVDLS